MLTFRITALAGATVSVGEAECAMVVVASDGRSLSCMTPMLQTTGHVPVIVTEPDGSTAATQVLLVGTRVLPLHRKTPWCTNPLLLHFLSSLSGFAYGFPFPFPTPLQRRARPDARAA